MSIFKNGTFAENKQRLEEELGYPCEKTPLKIVQLKQNFTVMTVAARPGSFVSVALLQYLGGAADVYSIDNERRVTLREFYAEKWEESGHPTIDFLRKLGVSVTRAITDRDNELQEKIEGYWDCRDGLATSDPGGAAFSVNEAIELLNYGVHRVAEPDESNVITGWKTNEWLKKAILLYFKLNPSVVMGDVGGLSPYYDKVPLKFTAWSTAAFERAGIRAVPGAVVRKGAFIEKGAILMPSFVNIGGYVGERTMIDAWATVGSCAQIGNDVHISGGAGIGGVLEPMQANPTIIEDGVFIGARSEVAEGVVVKKDAALSMGVYIGKNTPIVDMTKWEEGSGERFISRGIVPSGAVVLPGIHPVNGGVCPRIMKYRDSQTDAATALNEILRG